MDTAEPDSADDDLRLDVAIVSSADDVADAASVPAGVAVPGVEKTPPRGATKGGGGSHNEDDEDDGTIVLAPADIPMAAAVFGDTLGQEASLTCEDPACVTGEFELDTGTDETAVNAGTRDKDDTAVSVEGGDVTTAASVDIIVEPPASSPPPFSPLVVTGRIVPGASVSGASAFDNGEHSASVEPPAPASEDGDTRNRLGCLVGALM